VISMNSLVPNCGYVHLQTVTMYLRRYSHCEYTRLKLTHVGPGCPTVSCWFHESGMVKEANTLYSYGKEFTFAFKDAANERHHDIGSSSFIAPSRYR